MVMSDQYNVCSRVCNVKMKNFFWARKRRAKFYECYLALADLNYFVHGER